jgi:hypothetical protein
VTHIEKALYTIWIKRLGAAKVKELSADLNAGRSVSERSEAIVAASSERDLNVYCSQDFADSSTKRYT